MKKLLMLLLLANQALAGYNAKGWQWYSPPKTDETEIFAEEAIQAQSTLSYREQMKAFQAAYEEAQAKAVITKDIKDVARAMQLRQFMMEESKQYGIAFEKALLIYPELSYELKFPTQDSARMIHHEVENKRRQQAIGSFAKDHGLFLFYKGRDPYSPMLTKTLQEFASVHQMNFIGVSVDGVALDTIEHNVKESGQIKAWGVKALPAVFLYHHETKAVQPFAYGFISGIQIEKQFLQLATDYGQQPLPGDSNHAID